MYIKLKPKESGEISSHDCKHKGNEESGEISWHDCKQKGNKKVTRASVDWMPVTVQRPMMNNNMSTLSISASHGK